MNFPHRYVAQITIEALTPLAVGSDSLYYDQDSPVDKDFNNLPYIPGTAITGFLRKQIESALFGDKPDENNEQSKGSNIIISDAFLMDEKRKVKQELKEIKSEFLKQYFTLPIRQHTAINEYGAADDGSKFDTEVVFKGSRFKFEIELQVTEEQKINWESILKKFLNNNFYLGAGEFNNFGEMKVIEIKQKHFDLSNDLESYLNHDVDLNTNELDDYSFKINDTFYETEEITLSGENSFFHFGAGFGDDEADNINYTELVLDWDSNKENENYPFVEKFVIPGTSIKGTLAHRVAYHYNKNDDEGKFVEDLIENFETKVTKDLDKKYNLSNFKLKNTVEELEKQKTQLEKQLQKLENESLNTKILFDDVIGSNNDGISSLFGKVKNSTKENDKGFSGNIIIRDIYLDINTSQTLFMHNKIDRYTGGTIESALFSEKVLAIDEATLYYKYKKGTNLTYLEMALNDLKNGMLPLGGLVNKGHGIFVELEKTKENGN